ncbi:uncharacterized protein si:ch211-126c2.4 [Triplophysa rosa]|uniref:Uncharacterized protein n=1 Tax=Triplophysa rosa TaxID=992332 RepID=A0A9W7WJR5_TRIRA|nr:uncharacterized protein si:ch211-126c2.4 [Triplophysa rosa]XP_057205817.1 uncharacterized protein si:ch211-126c2.4 [Triplophysa rosa]KAI7802006.1 hypothetical protein IRJ41_021054 [Triplophysa rosa]
MESFLRWKLTQGGTILGGSSLQKPISSFQSKKLPDVCSSFYSIADEPFPQVSGFLEDTAGQSFLDNETGTALNSAACIQSERVSKHKNEVDIAPRNETANISDLNFIMPGVCSHLADESTSSKSLQNDKDITNVTASKVEGNSNDFSNIPTVSITSFEKSDFISGEKNNTFDVTQDLKERCGINTTNTGINAIVDLHDIKNTTSESVQSQEPREGSDARLNSTVDLDVARIKSGNATVDLVQTPNTKEDSDTGVNATVNFPNLDCTHDKINSCSDNSGASNTTTERLSEKHDGTIVIQPHELEEERRDGSPNSTRDAKIMSPLTKISEKANVTVESVEQTESAALQASGDIQSISVSLKPGEGSFTKLNTTTQLAVPDLPILKNTTIEFKSSSTEITSQASDVSKSVMSNAETGSKNREAEVETSTTAFVHPVETPSDSSKINVDECPPKTSKPGFVDSECIQNSDTGNISRNSIFCLDDTLDMKTSFMVTSTPIVFGKEPRFEILRDAKPTPMRKRLSVINSIEAHSCEELVGTSHHDGTVAAHVTQSSNRSQKVSTHCTSGHSTSEPVNEKKPPTKPIVKRQLPQLSSKLSHPKSGLPPRPQSSMNSSAAVRPKTVQVPNQAEASSSTLPGNKKAGQLNKAKHIGNVNYTASAGPVKTPVVSSVPGYTFTAVSKLSSSGIPQMKPSGRQPPTRKRMALKTPQTTRSCVETVQPPSSNKPSGLPGMRTRNSLLPGLGQKHLSNDDLPSAKRKRIGPTVHPTVVSDAVQPAEAAHESDCINCSKHHEKLERFLEELVRLRSECKNWGPLHEKLEKCVEELKRI